MSKNLLKILDSYGQTTGQEKRDISFLPLGGLEQSWVRNLEAAVNTRKKKLSASRTVERVTMFFRAKKKNEATCKKSHGQEHKMNAWKGMGYFVV